MLRTWIFLGARNSWKARHIGPRLHVVSCLIFHSARRQIGLHCFSDASHIQNKLKKKYTRFYSSKREAYSPSIGAFANNRAVVVGPWTDPVGGRRLVLIEACCYPLNISC